MTKSILALWINNLKTIFQCLYNMPIPKVIYQTWKTKNLHENCIKIRDSIQKLNPEYEMIL